MNNEVNRPMTDTGTKVLCLHSVKNGVARFFGKGEYVGQRKPQPNEKVFFMGHRVMWLVPCIELESGKRVYGCECWWGEESAVKEKLTEVQEWVEVDIDEYRKQSEDVIKKAGGSQSAQPPVGGSGVTVGEEKLHQEDSQ